MSARAGSSKPREQPAGRGGIRFALPVVLLAAAAWGGCSVERNYELLSFFFDGVPDPNAPPGARPGSGGHVVMLSSHQAYEDRQCSACHGETGRFTFTVSGFTELDSSVCLQCHAETITEFPFMHGPVVAPACLWCHEPHESVHEHLLKSPSPQMCLSCHELHLDVEPRIEEHSDLERDCLDCHLAHGGMDHYFLRAAEPEPADSSGDAGAPSSEDGPAHEREG